ncbi:MerR family transcriptional regulator [Boudabousia marimammalium]|uniref:MerR family transcriptional regulator n=1 Tax=Boudabousia marimammalium TaxID=156892 RepID=A0A1Q5PM14_9ACTO|nr:MerR family transcriptional regulator [Boudabousia marimammalium]OKL48080.1 MerR family transcriptional regulator [Boudabousia marimammalium]
MSKKPDDLRTVGEVSRLLGLSVRTLHYWEERGLVQPTERTWSEYRLYGPEDIERLQQVMIYRATGMSLDQIGKLFEDEGDAVTHLRRQRDLLIEKQGELDRMVQAVNHLLEETMSEHKLSAEEIGEILGDASFAAYQDEAEEKWGDTDDWKASAQVAAQMSASDWADMKTRTAQVESQLVAGMKAGVKPGSEEANRLAEVHRELVSAFFPVTHAKQVLLARGYVGDPRFRAYYEERAEGLAEWLKAIIDANAEANGVDPAAAQWQ